MAGITRQILRLNQRLSLKVFEWWFFGSKYTDLAERWVFSGKESYSPGVGGGGPGCFPKIFPAFLLKKKINSLVKTKIFYLNPQFNL